MTQTINSSTIEGNSALDLLLSLEKLGTIRAIDAQFARFIHQQCLLANHDASLDCRQQADHIALLAGLVSYEFGCGHICLRLNELDIQQTLSLSFLTRQHPELASRFADLFSQLQSVDWLALVENYAVQSNAVVGLAQINQAGLQSLPPPLPLMLEQDRLYLTRYWHYESQVADGFMARAKTLTAEPDAFAAMKQALNELFARDYRYLWDGLQSGEHASSIERQRLVCEMLDVVQTDGLDWSRIDGVLTQAKQVEQLNELDTLVPLSVCLNWQKVAAAVALTRQFSVISGGPGTGKTTTVAKLLAALITQSQQQLVSQESASQAAISKQVPIIKLVAPTGKAAARLTESIGLAIEQLPVSDEIKVMMPAHSSTIHRLLGARPNTVEYKYNQSNRLHLDILVVDEASMVDLPMMFRLLQALPSHARLILLGDKDQLASVEAGAILGDICQFTSSGYQAEFGHLLADLTGYQTLAEPQSAIKANAISDSLCMLQKSYRFHARSGVGQLAKAINAGSTKQVEKVWQQGFDDIHLHVIKANSSTDSSPESLDLAQAQSALCQMMTEAYSPYCQQLNQAVNSDGSSVIQGDLFASVEAPSKAMMEQKAQAVLKAFSQARLLCAVREGEFGVERMNQLVEGALARNKLINPVENEHWYVGRPVMISQNDSALGLHNGDIGICLLDESETTPRLRVFFEMPDGRIKGVLPSRVPKHELAFAMTIHKSQGSEFTHTVMLLPNKMNQILTRELIYTGVTRAKSRLDLFANPAILAQGVSVKTLRSSGLSDKLIKNKI
ncbi:exodeoxyribonuclease V subunit alpha [Vibrio sp. CK2-1]|uniref:exodeoxyribonuclease V subunit alpha n=1 Tax=Vibrio sp. CK2-1 TaxID=2912249 RepID=UPI001F014247|nr:exodeoxyribonuclease V subunit alpha [Vibrio sp. CK2-1]MCF7354045.1 exodeoxyribonuclease V subunit alpha [Vibrio sp. CK2-1]